MMNWQMTMAAVGLVFGIAATAYAATFSDIDGDGDGIISPAEFTAVYPDLGGEVWNQIDVDADGGLSPSEHQDALDIGLLPEA